MRAQTEEEVMAGLLPVIIDGQEVMLPVLRRDRARAWRAALQAAFAGLMDVEADTPEGIEAMSDAQFSLILAYDESGVLGDRVSLDSRITDLEQDAIFNRLIEVSFPNVGSLAALLATVIRRAAESAQASSTSSGSVSGGSPRRTSTATLPTSSSTGSGRRRRNATAVSSVSA